MTTSSRLTANPQLQQAGKCQPPNEHGAQLWSQAQAQRLEKNLRVWNIVVLRLALGTQPRAVHVLN